MGESPVNSFPGLDGPVRDQKRADLQLCLKKNSLAAAREKLDCALAAVMEAATAEVSENAQLRKALAEGEQRALRRFQTILLQRIDMHPFESDPIRRELLQLLEEIAR